MVHLSSKDGFHPVSNISFYLPPRRSVSQPDGRRKGQGQYKSFYDHNREMALWFTSHWPELDHMSMKKNKANVVSARVPSQTSGAFIKERKEKA